MSDRHLDLSLRLETNRTEEAARQAWELVPRHLRSLLTDFAAAVVLLAESPEASEAPSVLLIPAESVPAVVRELGRKR